MKETVGLARSWKKPKEGQKVKIVEQEQKKKEEKNKESAPQPETSSKT